MSSIQRVLSVSLLFGLLALAGCREAGTSPSGTSSHVDGAIESVSPYVLLTNPPKDIENRMAKRAEQQVTGQEVVTMLELAAYADVNCRSMEYPLRVATLQYIQMHKDEADVREALRWIKSSYQSRLRIDSSKDTPEFVSSSLPQSMKIRMSEYADALLQAKTKDEALKEQTPARDKVKETKVSKRVRLQ